MKNRITHRRGVALIMVLIVIVLLSLGAYSFTDLMIAHQSAAIMSGRRVQAQAAVASGVEFIKDYLASDAATQEAMGGHYDNPAYFQDVVVATELEGSMRFSVISIVEDDYGEPVGIRFGLQDAESKININHVATSSDYAPPGGTNPTDPRQEALMVLPGMTEDLADGILDWIDDDSVPRPMGAESDYYSFLGYEPRNGPIDSLDELLLVRGMSPELLYGADRNHNGMAEDFEQEFAATLQGTGLGSTDRGWSAFLTVTSKDVPSQDEPIDLNEADLQTLSDQVAAVFDEDTATFIVAYRQNGPNSNPLPPGAPPPQQVNGGTVDPALPASDEFTSVLDLIGARINVQFQGSPTAVDVASPFSDDTSSMAGYLPNLMANLMVDGGTDGEGRVNINQASQTVLSSIPEITDTIISSILGQRDSTGLSTDPNDQYVTWILASGLVTVDEMKALMPFISVSGGVFRAQIVGYSDMPGAFARAEVVIDATEDPPKVVSWRDLTHLGPGFSLEMMAP